MSKTLRADLLAQLEQAQHDRSTVSFPATRYQKDIIGFCRDVLGFTPCRTLDELVAIRDREDAAGVPHDDREHCLWPTQIEMLEAVQNGNRVAIASGQKIGKSHSSALIALWFYCCFAEGKVIMTSTVDEQVRTILWEEFCKVKHRAERKTGIHIPGHLHEDPSKGLMSDDFRVVRGFTARKPESFAGISGRNLLFIVDEASGVEDRIHEAVQGNTAGGARIVMFSNPTKTHGTFFEVFHSRKAFWRTFEIASTSTPNAVTGRYLIPGLADHNHGPTNAAEYGEESSWYQVRVLGKFPKGDATKPFSLAIITASEQAWPGAVAEGRLCIGLDPAGHGEGGDETAYCVRRGNKVLEILTNRRHTAQDMVDTVIELVRTYGSPSEVLDSTCPIVFVDENGPVGVEALSTLLAHFKREQTRPVRIVGMKPSRSPLRRPDLYGTLRDELWANLERFLKRGGTIPTDSKLRQELDQIEWTSISQGRLKATDKKLIRQALGRSPDRADALCLAVWEPTAPLASRINTTPPPPTFQGRGGSLDPYTANRRQGGIDPYGGR